MLGHGGPRILAQPVKELALGCLHAETGNPKFRDWLLTLSLHFLSLGRVPLGTLATLDWSWMSVEFTTIKM